nr:MAG TPA: hypothetical protein [Caudoviricetes sp.]
MLSASFDFQEIIGILLLDHMEFRLHSLPHLL